MLFEKNVTMSETFEKQCFPGLYDEQAGSDPRPLLLPTACKKYGCQPENTEVITGKIGERIRKLGSILSEVADGTAMV